MASFDVLSEDPPPSRTGEEEEDFFTNVKAPKPILASLTEKGSSMLTDGKLQSDFLIIAISSASRALFECIQCGQICFGEIVLPEYMPANPNAPRVIHEEKSPLTFIESKVGNDKKKIVFVRAPLSLPEDRTVEWTKTLFSKIDSKRILVLSSTASIPSTGERYGQKEKEIFRLETDKWKMANYSKNLDFSDFDYLPRGTLLDGLPAAILSYCQVRHAPALLLVAIQEFFGPQVTSLQAIISVLSSILGPTTTDNGIFDQGKLLKSAIAILRKEEASSLTLDVYV